MKYFLEISYIGKNYCGWQIQPNANTIQEELEKAFFLIFSERITINGSSRTDTGVHARQQFAHFEIQTEIFNTVQLINRLNKILPEDISVQNIYHLSEDSHSRFDAVSRKYIYRIIHNKDPFHKDIAALIFKKPDLELLNKSCYILKKHIDFEAFSKVKTDVKTFDCQILEAFWIYNGQILEFHIKANRFLRGMVRAIVGTQLMVGFGKISLDDFENIILSKKRENAGMAAKANGLTLEEVNYPFEYFK
ncbi:MAG: tRNA pseudouridine(38-40) synthase TruA [Spirosomataceae bacterium]|jgi:tRNA pseudouridine38-40 synthase